MTEYVSRGGDKLQSALTQFNYSPQDQIALDVGAATGGFTDCLLQQGARFVFTVDVSYGQLAWKLRQDPRVHVQERFNARYLLPSTSRGVIRCTTTGIIL
jgi:23S rRNA (cytidine1920-2'-O)/16S rRNA (cytidine1409-2'-O)-methyltransferase